MAKDTSRADDRSSIERELKRGSLELIVLHLLEPGEAYGYEIVSKLTSRTNGSLGVTDGTLYPVLYRLERGGIRRRAVGNPRPRRPAQVLPAHRRRSRRARAPHAEWNAFASAMARLLAQKERP